MRRARRERATLGVLAVLAALLIGCIDPYYSIVRRAPCPGVPAAQIRAALAACGEFEIRDFETDDRGGVSIGGGRTVLELWAMRDRSTVAGTVHVTVEEDPATIRLCVGNGAPPRDADERARWIAALDAVAERIQADCPAISAWTFEDGTGPNAFIPAVVLLCLGACTCGGLLVVWLARRARARPGAS